MWKSALSALMDVIAPARCPGCEDERPSGKRGFCEVCAPLLEPCAFGMGAYEYGGPMAEAISALKYKRRTEFALPLGDLLAHAAMRHIGRVDVVVAVPLHASRRRNRGFNQSELLARRAALSLGLHCDSRLLQRVRPTPAQVGLSNDDRKLNVVGAFEPRRQARVYRRVLLIDDVVTTGATLEACADALYVLGVEEVRMIALASSPLR